MSETMNTIREPYEPPVIEDIPLHPREQVLAGCKTAGGFGTLRDGGSCDSRACRRPGAS
jgi:hypothetical protein